MRKPPELARFLIGRCRVIQLGRSKGMVRNLRILIVDANQVRAAIIEEGLREAGYHELIRVSGTTGLVAAIEWHDPDVVVVDLENPSRDALADMFLVSRHVKRPITMFVDQSDAASIEEAVEAGVSAYIVDGLKKERLKPILQTCISRFNAFSRLQQELDEARSQLDDRKTIDRAKGIVMRLKGLSEEEAYALLRKTAMNEKRKLVDIARSIITAAEVL
jgi:two-component system, response regulator / RNA-binding antiterminator